MARPASAKRLAIIRPFEEFFRLESAGGIVLLFAAIVALAWANSPFADAYDRLWHTPVVVGAGAFVLEKDLLHWVNDGLMAIFFLLVGLEIKREFLTGELSTARSAALPAVAAVGGMVVPALFYAALNRTGDGVRGWGIPMATDIAFALGALSVLGSRVPVSLRIFLAAAAIVDDLGAVLVIAIFYTAQISTAALLAAGAAFGALVLMNRLGARHPLPYVLVGIVLWVAVLKSGVHATVAGVLLAMTIPAGPRVGPDAFVQQARDALARFPKPSELHHPDEERRNVAITSKEAALTAIEDATEAVQAPLTRLEHGLVPWVSFGIMPIFALANAGVRIEGNVGEALTGPVALGIALGLILGKQIGVTLSSYLAVRLGLASMPAGATWWHVYGVSWLAGIGFTMSLFINGLSLPPELQDDAKLAILVASTLSAIGGLLLLSRGGRVSRGGARAST